MKIYPTLIPALRTALLAALLSTAAQCKTVDNKETVPIQEQMHIGSMEVQQYLSIHGWSTTMILDYSKYRYYKDSFMVGIRIPVNNIPNLFMYAFKSATNGGVLQLCLTQVYSFSADNVSSFNGFINWLDFKDFKVRRSTYVNSQEVSYEVMRSLDFMRYRYEDMNDLPHTQSDPEKLNAIQPEMNNACAQAGGFSLVPYNSQGLSKNAECLFSYDPQTRETLIRNTISKSETNSTSNVGPMPYGPEWKGPESDFGETPFIEESVLSKILFWNFSWTSYGPIGTVVSP